MFRKLLKYDMRAVAKYWWLGALAASILSVIGGFCIQILKVDYTEHDLLISLAIIGLVLTAMAYIAFSIINTVLIYVRFYKNFFTDEGYLTFTLPVRRSQLLGSKLVTATLFTVFTSITIFIGIAMMLIIGVPEEIFNREFLATLSDIFNEIVSVLGFYTVIYIVEFILGVLALTVFTVMVIFTCLTLASAITKKHKFIAAIGIYYAYNAVVSTITQLLFFDTGLYTVFERLGTLPESDIKLAVSIIGLGLVALVTLACAGLYALEEFILRRKLNLD